MSNNLIRHTMAVAGLAAVVLAGAAGIAGAAMQSGSHPHGTPPSRHHRTGRPTAPFATRAESLRLARKLLSKAVLPPGTHRFSGRRLPAQLRHPPEKISATTTVDAYRVFAEQRSMHRTVAFLNHHHPAGWSNDGGGSYGQGKVITEEYVAYRQRHPGAAFSVIEMLVSVVPGHHGHALTRVDIQVIWYPRRPASEYLVARDFRAVRIERVHYDAKPVWRTFRQRAIIDKLIRLVNLAPASPGGAWSCPIGGTFYQLTFKPLGGERGASVQSPGCPPIYSVSIGGHSKPDLADDGKIEAIVDHLLHGSH
jgi:hypothetical protein